MHDIQEVFSLLPACWWAVVIQYANEQSSEHETLSTTTEFAAS